MLIADQVDIPKSIRLSSSGFRRPNVLVLFRLPAYVQATRAARGGLHSALRASLCTLVHCPIARHGARLHLRSRAVLANRACYFLKYRLGESFRLVDVPVRTAKKKPLCAALVRPGRGAVGVSAMILLPQSHRYEGLQIGGVVSRHSFVSGLFKPGSSRFRVYFPLASP